MMEELKQKVNEVYNWTVEDGKPQPPKQDLPQAVKDRADYFWEMAEDGMTFMGAMECILMKSLPTMIWELLRVGCQNLRSLMIGLAIRQACLR
ncbi:gp24 [Streptococcus pneumoniae]|nr:gp24 [Streptococcus pneumoniae]CWA58856.1 gp24 [Streptococcus pneumoniae]